MGYMGYMGSSFQQCMCVWPATAAQVFFGESLPARFFELLQKDFPQCDLLIVLGTSLVVHPFASLIGGALLPSRANHHR
jgi:NAD-dependent SIR2 family protein deacetylase